MKTIEPVLIWDKGQNLEASVLAAYSTNVILGVSASFNYYLYSLNEEGIVTTMLTQGYLNMTGEDYKKWEADSYAWDWVASQLKLTITGDYVPPVSPEPIPPAPITTETNN
jgi:hypothetical protein